MSGESFGVGKLPGSMVAQNHGSHMKSDGETFEDSARANPPSIRMGSKMMDATAHSDHGPHGHIKARSGS